MPCDETRFNEMLEVLPPLAWCSKGFLVGEAWSHRDCTITGRYCATFMAMVDRSRVAAPFEARFVESTVGLTVAEWRALNFITLTIGS
jgi:hypothetical protein